jgi:hypothetical protein
MRLSFFLIGALYYIVVAYKLHLACYLHALLRILFSLSWRVQDTRNTRVKPQCSTLTIELLSKSESIGIFLKHVSCVLLTDYSIRISCILHCCLWMICRFESIETIEYYYHYYSQSSWILRVVYVTILCYWISVLSVEYHVPIMWLITYDVESISSYTSEFNPSLQLVWQDLLVLIPVQNKVSIENDEINLSFIYDIDFYTKAN